jgi:hypothetical protein
VFTHRPSDNSPAFPFPLPFLSIHRLTSSPKQPLETLVAPYDGTFHRMNVPRRETLYSDSSCSASSFSARPYLQKDLLELTSM